MINERTHMVAKACQACEREWHIQHGETDYPAWDDLSDEQRDDKLLQVDFLLDNPHLGAAAVHDNWIARRSHADSGGWRFGPRFDADLKTDPKMMPFGRLSPVEQTI